MRGLFKFLSSGESYKIDYSCDFAGNNYLYRYYTTAGNRKLFTFSTWIKANTVEASGIFGGGVFYFAPDYDELTVSSASGHIAAKTYDGSLKQLVTTAVQYATSWKHFMWVFDSDQGTESNRSKIYVDGVQITDFSTETYPTQGQQAEIFNTLYPVRVGMSASLFYLDGKLADTALVEGQALSPTSFGKSIGGTWSPIDLTTLSFGTNGWWLRYGDSGDLGVDSSGNGNNFTTSGTLTQSTDVP